MSSSPTPIMLQTFENGVPIQRGAGQVLAGAVGLLPIAKIGHTAAPDANYYALVTDTQIGFAVLTDSRTVILPDVDAYPLGQEMFIADESGQCSADRIIRIVPGTGSNDTIAGDDYLLLSNRYQGVGLRRGAANIWIISR